MQAQIIPSRAERRDEQFVLMTSIGERLKKRAKELGLSDAEVARRAGIEQRTYANYALGKRFPKPQQLAEIAKVLGITPNDILGFTPNVEPGPDVHYLPLISWVQAGEWTEIADHQPGDYEALIPVTRRYSNRAFALRIAGDSMQAPDGDSFPEGSIISVEPLQEARNGSYVVVRNGHSEEATFKQLIIDGSRRYLKPLNPRYPIIEITEEIIICGVVRQLVMEFDK